MKPTYKQIFIGLFILALISGSAILSVELFSVQQEREQLAQNLTETQGALQEATSTIGTLRDALNRVRADLQELEDDYQREKNRNEEFEDKIRGITDTVGTLEKLSQTDEELLQKYSRVYFLNENYVPSDLDRIPSKYLFPGVDDQYFHANAIDYLEELLEEAEDDGIDLRIVSAYRSFDEQIAVKESHRVVYGEGSNAFSADQGYSEHQLGTAVDFTTPGNRQLTTSFSQTTAYEWLQKHAHKYGFVLSYPENNQFYIFEPWHWRFVGVDLARDLERDGAGFYDWPQRDIDKYLISIFD